MRKNDWLIVLLIAVAALVWWVALRPPKAVVAFLDVGQGDATYIRTPAGAEIIIDGGPGEMILGPLGRVRAFWDQEIELLVLTHPHRDHLEGFLALIERYRINKLWWTGVASPTEMDDQLIEKLKMQGTQITVVREGELFVSGSGSNTEARLEVLSPELSLAGSEVKNLNDSSIMSKYTIGGQCIIFPGDAQTEELNLEAAEEQSAVDCEVLKASHHGSRNGTTEAWLAAITPKYTVISSGANNRHGHPHQETIDLVTRSGSQLLRTDQQGTIFFYFTGNDWRVVTGSPKTTTTKSSAGSADD